MNVLIGVRTPAILREFLLSRNKGSNVLVMDQNDVFARKIIPMLTSPPKDYVPKRDCDDEMIYVKIKFFELNGVNNSAEYKNYLSEESQRSIVYEWNNTFKEIFHNYVLAYCQGMNFRRRCQMLGINSFCDHYDIPRDAIVYDSLKKSWDRSRQKKKYPNHFKLMGIKKNKNIVTEFVPSYSY